MKRIALISLLFCLSHTIAVAQSTAIVPVNGIAIVVNDEVITRQELHDRIHMIEQRLKMQGITPPPPAQLQQQIIERMIVDRAQLQLARDIGLKVDDAMLDRALMHMAEQSKMSLQGFRDRIEKEGISYAQFRENVREDILLQRVMEREVDSKVQVNESEIDNYLAAQKGEQQNQNVSLSGKLADLQPMQGVPGVQGVPQAHVRHILIKVTPTVTKEEATAKLLELKQRLDHGSAHFEDLAKHYSNDPTASKGGDLGWIYPGDVPAFDPVINTLKEGEVSAPIDTQFGVHLIQVVGRKVDEVSPDRQRAIARQAIHARKVEEATLEWMHQLRDSAYVEIRGTEQQ
jgi:peptidyl-prolyl cis-trans isomerase SurA